MRDIRRNREDSFMYLISKILLRKKSITGSINDMLKNICQIEHTRYLSLDNFIINMISALIRLLVFSKNHPLNGC
ncbi:MAG: hypothetical protein HXX16_15745 [Bacteroidales bacterium]|nr:hypothetical protein [Bacteroidales bacterium]